MALSFPAHNCLLEVDINCKIVSSCFCLLGKDQIRAVAPSPAGPVFAAGTKILNNEDMHSKPTFKLGGGTGLRLNNVLKAKWSCYSVAGLSLNKE